MKIVKYLFFLLLLVFIGSAIYFGTKEGSFEIENSQQIDAPLPVVFKEVNNLEHWDIWGPWDKGKDYHFSKSEQQSGEGATVHWTGDDKGSIVTTKVIPDSEIEQQITYHTFFGERTGRMVWKFESVDEQTLVTWTLSGKHNLMEKIYFALSRKDFDSGWRQRKDLALKDMQEAITEAMNQYALNVDGISHYGGGYYLYTSSVTKEGQIHHKMLPMFREVLDFAENNNIQNSGQPFIIYNEKDNSGNIIFSAGVPVKEQVITPESSPVVAAYMNPITAVKVSLKGKYNHIPEAYSLARAYIRENGYEENREGKVFEIYSVREKDTPNPAEWVTEIYVPIISDELETSDFNL